MDIFDFTSESSSDSLDYSSSVDSEDDSEVSNETVEEERSVLFSFYDELTEHMISHFNESRERVQSSTKLLIDNYKNTKNGRNPQKLDFNDLSLCLGYLHRYAICHTVMVQNAVTNVLDSSCADVERKFNLKRLNVVFLGSGPGNDFVGFLSALYGHHDRLFEVEVTSVDRHLGWKKIFDETIGYLRNGSFGNASKIFEDINIISNYVEADLTESSTWSDDIKTSLEKADLVFLVKVLSHIPDEKKLVTLQNIVHCMPDDALLIFIDYPYPSLDFFVLQNYISLIYDLKSKPFMLNLIKTKFGYPNIIKSSSTLSVFKKQNSTLENIFHPLDI